MRVIHKVISYLKYHPGLVLLIILLSIISIQTIKPGFYLLGWDNYSSYFNLKTNIFRTLFSTWREYRGLGVPSDAEATDIFRQIFYWILHFISPEQLLDQLYYVFALWVGVLGMYASAVLLFKDLNIQEQRKNDKYRDIFGLLASLLYLFNLNTLSVFYSPIIPFTNRFYSLPLIVFFIFRYIKGREKIRNLFFLVITIVITSGSYITPTVIIPSVIAIFTFLAIRLNLKKAIQYSLIFLLLNAFWILPFINYVTQKSSLISLARTFIEINESTLNKPSSVYSLGKQAILYPSFFEISFSTLTGTSYPIHPLLEQYKKPFSQFILSLFPLCYGLGVCILLFHWKKNKKSLWIPLWIIVFLFLSSKEFSPLGFLYVWLNRHFPLFGVIFRIPDTKFHAYISFAGSIAGAYAIIEIFTYIRKKIFMRIIKITLLILGLSYIWLFRTYFTGNLIGFFAYTKIPKAYYSVAKVINDAPGRGRVLHLPLDSWHFYWRSFSWGYLGSSFFNYFIDKPYIDKTFEPASMENTYLHAKLISLVDSFYRTSDTTLKKQFADRYLQLLQKTGVQFVLLDESISSSIYTRNTLYSAKQSFIQTKELIEFLQNNNFVVLRGSYPISLKDLYPAYKTLYPVREIGLKDGFPLETHIDIYEVKNSEPVFRYLPHVLNIDPILTNLLETNVNTSDQHIIQDSKKPAQLIPFMQQRHTVSRNDSSYTFTYQNPNSTTQNYQVKMPSSGNDSFMIDVYGRTDKDQLNLAFYHRYYPDINGQIFRRPVGSVQLTLPNISVTSTSPATLLSNWSMRSTKEILDTMRLELNGVFVPLPVTLSTEESYITSYILHDKEIHVSLLKKSLVQSLDILSFTQTNPSSCYGPPADAYEGDMRISTTGKNVLLTAKNGSFCATTPITFPSLKDDERYYAEIEVQLEGQLQNGNSINNGKESKSLIQSVLQNEGEKQMQGYICVREGTNEDCLNPHRNIRISKNVSAYRIPFSSYISPFSDLKLEIGSVGTENIKQTLTVQGVQLHVYEPFVKKDISFNPIYPEENVSISGPLQISFPKALSQYSYVHKPQDELFYMPQEPCRPDNPKPRITRFFGNTLFNRMDNCSVYFAERFNYAFGRPYLFVFDYWLGGGQQPSMVLGRKGDDFLFERASLYQGYPNLSGMKQFQDPRIFDTYNRVLSDIKNIKLTTASRLIEPKNSLDLYAQDMAIHLFQDTANHGLMALGSFDMVEYPSLWYGMTLTPAGSQTIYNQPTASYSYKQILPSLWRLDGSPDKGLLRFNEGYDAQWGIYDSLWNVVFGKSLAWSIRCDGFANCFELDTKNNPKILYVFYWPERLSVIGWSITFLIVIVCLISTLRRKAMTE